ncbi:MAG TPA: integrase core domain-containing protein [Candidatus Hydrogenedentes bacterium]|nr:integrase core domain-containing protein [Candidatus Hydrogenedentota bacterium]
MERVFQVFLALVMRFFLPRHNAHVQFMRAQLRILRARIPAERIVPTPAEKAELLRWGAAFDHDVDRLVEVVKPATYRRWLCLTRGGFTFKRSGRPRIVDELRRLVGTIAHENVAWGYRRIVGELKKLGIAIGTTTVKRILAEQGIYPAPEKARKKPPMPWTDFVHAHIDVFVACDFFTKPVYTLRGVFDAYVLVFIDIGTRKVFCSAATYQPDSDWVVQQARNAAMWLEDISVTPRFLVHDADTKFDTRFKNFWKSAGVRCIRTPIRAPRANSFCEKFIGSLKHECLNNFLCFSRGQLDYITKIWCAHYNTRRPHQGVGIGNNVLDKGLTPQVHGTIRCRRQLGGIIKDYYRDAA